MGVFSQLDDNADNNLRLGTAPSNKPSHYINPRDSHKVDDGGDLEASKSLEVLGFVS